MSYLSELFLKEVGMEVSTGKIQKGLEACEKEYAARNQSCGEQELCDLWDVVQEFEDVSSDKYEVLKACKCAYEKRRNCDNKGD